MDNNENFIDKLNKRIDDLQSEFNYYTRPRKLPVTFSEKAHAYYNTIPTRLLEIEYILKNLT